jgi:predicted esterase
LKALLSYAEKENAGEAAAALAKEVLAADPKDPTANAMLGRVKNGEEWVDPWNLLVQKGGLKNEKVRYEIHAMLDSLRKEPAKTYAPDPWAGTEKVPAPDMQGMYVWKAPIKGLGDGKGTCFLWASKKYNPSKKWPLLIYLHGGGSGGVEQSIKSASNNLAMYQRSAPDNEYICLAPTVRVHPINAWNVKENMLDVIDAIIDACDRFNIDRRRIYMSGASMGAQGTSRFSWVVPELFAAFAPQSGAYWNNHPVPNLEGKPYLVLHGAKDAEFRNKTCREFLEKLKAANAPVEYVEYPDMGHGLDDKVVVPKVLEFFRKHQNTFNPDLRLVRRVIEETVTEKPYVK